ncbi:type I restriction-modificationenzyme 1, R subunit [Leptotrichia shahii]|uniref:Type I restriction-modificationenzyme 1, R subunit n=1 Tax=Leptotrichia shahii TaxID=157691 RepID=A0A510JQN0_9FUSO|nr:hypothetical protein [Leptotrichia shahii]BBM39973.1 type I restriction-modificationenzyme 1, R subunit [Leptotrichia shahii]
MRKLFLILGIFLMMNFEIYGFTQKEKIQETLSKLGVKQELIDETIALDYEIRDTQYFEEDEKIIRERVAKLEKLLQKDKRNYIAAQALITIFESKISGDYKKYLDLFEKYTPYEYTKTFSKMMYALDQGNMPEFEKIMDEIPKKYNDPAIVALSKIFVAKNPDEKQMLTEKVLKLLKEESERRKIGVSDEEYHLMKLTYYLNKIRRLFDNGEVKQAVAEYLNNVANDDVSNEIRNYNLRAEVILYFNVVIMNEEIKEVVLKINNGVKLEDTWIADKIQKETEKDKDFLAKMVN